MGNRISDSFFRKNSLLTQAKARRWNTSACALLLIAATFAATAAGAQSVAMVPHRAASGDAPSPEPTQTIVYHSPGTMPSMCGFGFMASGGGASEARARLLDKEGPQSPRVFSMSSFSVMGFVKGNWPVVFDYQLERDSLLIVVIAPEGHEPIIYRLNGKAGHWQNRLLVPAGVGTDSVVAEYTLRSLDDGVGQLGPAHLHVHGIAAGPKGGGFDRDRPGDFFSRRDSPRARRAGALHVPFHFRLQERGGQLRAGGQRSRADYCRTDRQEVGWQHRKERGKERRLGREKRWRWQGCGGVSSGTPAMAEIADWPALGAGTRLVWSEGRRLGHRSLRRICHGGVRPCQDKSASQVRPGSGFRGRPGLAFGQCKRSSITA